MTKLRGISDTINMLDKYNFDYIYDYDRNTYEISDEDFQYMMNKSKNKDYIKRLEVGKGSDFYSGSRHATLADTSISTEEFIFTPAAVLDLLVNIKEFDEFDFGLTEGLDGSLQLQVNDSIYDLTTDSKPADIQVEESIIEEIADVNETAYEDLINEGVASDLEPIESGLIKEALKTLAIGGLVRLGKHYLLDK